MSHLSLSSAIRGHSRFASAASHLQSLVLLILRLTWGWSLAEAGYGHLTHIENTVSHFKEWGIPFPLLNVYVSGSMELVGGSLLILGLATRLIALPLVFNFIVAYAAASRDALKELFTGNHRDGFDAVIADAAFPMLMLALIMLAFGPGKASLDYVLSRLFAGKEHGGAESLQTR